MRRSGRMAGSTDTHRINPHGRYSHARSYVTAVLDTAGFFDTSVESESLRLELGKPVAGWVVRARVRGA